MSSDNQPDDDFSSSPWHNQTEPTSFDEGAGLRALASSIHTSTIFPANIDFAGGVSIQSPKEWGIPFYAFDNFRNTYKADCRPMPKTIYQHHKGGPKQACTFWLKPGAVRADAIETFDTQLNQIMANLANECGIHPLETRIFVPNSELEEKINGKVGIAVVLATDAEHAPQIPKLVQRLYDEIRAAKAPAKAVVPEIAWEQSRGFLAHADNWEQRFSAHKPITRRRDQLALEDFMEDHSWEFPLHPIDIKPESIDYRMPRSMAQTVLHEAPKRSAHVSFPHFPPNNCHGTKGIALWMRPEFFSADDLEFHDTDTPMSWQERIDHPATEYRFMRDAAPRIESMVESLRHLLHIPVYATVCHSDPEFFNTVTGPCMVALMTEPPYEHILATKGRDLLAKASHKAHGRYNEVERTVDINRW